MGGNQSYCAEMRLLLVGARGCGTNSVLKHLGLRRRASSDDDEEDEDVYPRTYDAMKGMKVTVADQAIAGEDLWTPSLGGGPFDAVALVVDCRMGEAIHALQSSLTRLLAQEEMVGRPLLVLAAHASHSDSMTVPQVASRLGVVSMWDRRWSIQAASRAESVLAGIDWLVDRVSEDDSEPVVTKITSADKPLLGRTASGSVQPELKQHFGRILSAETDTTAGGSEASGSDEEADTTFAGTFAVSWRA